MAHDAITRRDVLRTVAGISAASLLPGCPSFLDPYAYSDGDWRAATAILRADYTDALTDVITAGFALVPPPNVLGKRVMLKANLVDLPRHGKPVATHPAVLAAAAEAFRRRGAAEVVVADGSGLQRDVWQIVDATGLATALKEHNLTFVDLNIADIRSEPNTGGMSNFQQLHFASDIWNTDVLVSVPRMKTHHWAGATLAMKNLVGTLSGQAYGWPRNAIHLNDLYGTIVDINCVRGADYAIVDGVVGMEGDGPVRGDPIDVGVIIMGNNLPAVDATGARLMDLVPERIDYLRRAAGILGPISEDRIEQRGETIASLIQPFALLPHLASLRG